MRLFGKKDEQLFLLFNESARVVVRGGEILQNVVHDYRDLDVKMAKLTAMEHEGDRIIQELMRRLNTSFILPFDREDAFQLVQKLATTLDYITGIIDRMILYKAGDPDLQVKEMVEVLSESIKLMEQAFNMLDKIERKNKEIIDCCKKIIKLEKKQDNLYRNGVARLFEEHENDPIQLIKWREANNYTNLGKGLYGYDFSYELIDGKYRITAYLDRRLLPQAAGNQERMFTPMAAAAIKGLGTVKTVLDIGGDINDLKGAAGDLATTGKMIELLNKYENVRPNLESHLQEYYDRQIAMMGEDILMGKSLGYIGSTVAEAGNLVPLLGQVVIGVAELISGELLGNMFDNEFQSDYNRLMAEMRLLPGGQEDYYENYQEPYADYHPEPMDSYWYWYWYVYQRDKWIDVGHDDLWRYRDRPFIPHWVYDPSGFVYEGVEDNRIQGVTATALFLPASAAQNAAEAKASQDWQFWDASWYLQENPQTTDAEGRYAWDVPTGWWMVQYVKDGYQTAYSDALPVPPPQLDVNIPLVRLESPAVEKTVWGSGGRYVDVYFSKYMDIRSLEAANSISLTDNEGSPVSGKIEFPMAPKTGVNNLSLTKVARFAADVPMTAGGQYKLTVNQAVADYAGFSMTADYSETGTIPPGAPIASLTGIDITVEPGLDITQDVMDALVFTPVNPEDQGILDKLHSKPAKRTG